MIDWFDLAVQRTLKSSPTPQFKSTNSLVLSFLHSPTLTSIHDHRKNHSLDITLPTKVCVVKAMVFPVVMYGCKSWTVKKADASKELMLLNCGVGEDS